MIRAGTRLHLDPNSIVPEWFSIDVDDPNYEEDWSESVFMYHNPNAIIPVDMDCFPTINHMWLDNKSGDLNSIHREGDILNSITTVLETVEKFKN
jgi:hypothetical protein